MEEKVKIAVHVLTSKDGEFVKERYVSKIGEDGVSLAQQYVETRAVFRDASIKTFYEEISTTWANEIFGDSTLYSYWGMTIG